MINYEKNQFLALGIVALFLAALGYYANTILHIQYQTFMMPKKLMNKVNIIKSVLIKQGIILYTFMMNTKKLCITKSLAGRRHTFQN